MKKFALLIVIVAIYSCKKEKDEAPTPHANHLAELP